MDTPEWAIEPEKKQGGAAWHKWRAKGIGSSDAPIIMGVSPWKTPVQLWQNKTGKVKDDFKGNPATERGHRLEPVVRRRVEKKLGRKFPDETFIDGIFLASMDGWDKTRKEGLEIKCINIGDHMTAQASEVPEKYKWQLVHQFIASGAQVIWYASFYCVEGEDEETGGDLRVFPISRSRLDCKKYMKKANEFWQFVLTDTQPPFMPSDTVKIEGSELTVLADKYKSLKEELDLKTRQIEYIKRQIITLMKQNGHKKIECNGLKIRARSGRHEGHYTFQIKD